MIIQDTGLKKLCEEGALTPYDPTLVQPASIDLRLGTTFLVGRAHETPFIDLARVPRPELLNRKVSVSLYKEPCTYCQAYGTLMRGNQTVFCDRCVDGYRYNEEGKFVIHPGEIVLGSTLERIRVPSDVVMALEGKSSLARLFLLPHVQAGYFDPGWDGVGTLEIVNLNRVPIILRPGLTICQSRWTRLEGPPAKLYSGHYQGDEGATGSRYEG